jgi:hypothetical protein
MLPFRACRMIVGRKAHLALVATRRLVSGPQRTRPGREDFELDVAPKMPDLKLCVVMSDGRDRSPFHPLLGLNAALSSSRLMGAGQYQAIVTEAPHIQGSIVLGHRRETRHVS